MKKIVVFGATGGLGVKLTPLLKEKYEVVELGSKDVNVCDLTDVQNFFKENDFDIVLNMSGKSYDTYVSKIDKDNYKSVTDMLDVNIMGNINILSSCLPKMIEKKWGRIIVISSILSEMNVPKASVYSASKAFIDRLVSGTNKENIRYGITCNSIQLGYWDGGMCERLEPKFQSSIKEMIGLKRFGKIEELYNTIDYIISNEYICGINLKLNGGI